MRSKSVYHTYRKWQKVVQPLVRYNRDTSDLGYPLTFFFQLEQNIEAGYPLHINIATTLTGSKDNCIKTVFQGKQEVGRVIFTPSILKSSFDSQIQKEMQDRLNKQVQIYLRFCQRDSQFDSFYHSLKLNNTNDQMLPLAVIKQKEGKGQCRVITQSRDQFRKITNLEVHQIAQSFIYSSGKQTSIIRFFYSPTKQNHQAFKIDNHQGFMKRKFCRNQFKVRQDSENSLTFVKIMYTNKSFYHQTQTLVDYFERHKKIKISKLVTDWILDPHNRYHLIDVKELTFTKAQEQPRPLRSLTDTLAYLTCQVCQQKYREDQITKILTRRLISQFVQHLKKRQMSLSFNIPNKPSTDTSKVCDLCYMLVVSEAELIELQKKVARITHSIKENQSLTSTILTGQKGKLFQWRLFMYLEDIRDLQIDQIDQKSTYYIMIRIHNSITSFKIKNPSQKYHLIKGIKIHYLFSQTQNIQKFLTNSQIIIRITKGNHWNSVIAQGNTSGLYEQSEKHSMRKFKQILVFNQRSKYSVVGIHLGVKMEGMYDPSQLALQKNYDVFMVEDGYSNCYALPAEWMETIDPSYCISKTESTTFSYGLHLGKRQKKALFPSLNPQNKKKLVL